MAVDGIMYDFQHYYIVPKSTLNNRLHENPSVKDLLKVAKKVGGKWRNLLIGLNIPHATTDQVWQKSFGDPEQACLHGLVKWRSGGIEGHNQATWSALLSALKNEAENGELAHELEQELQCTQRGIMCIFCNKRSACVYTYTRAHTNTHTHTCTHAMYVCVCMCVSVFVTVMVINNNYL